MRRVVKVVGVLVLVVVALPVVGVVGLDVYLNTGAGRGFAAREVGKLTGGEVKIAGLAGHFPDYIAADRIEVADRKGVYLTLDHVVLRWSPFGLLHRAVKVQDLTAQTVDFARLPVPATKKPKTKSSKLPIRSAVVDHFAVGRLAVGQAVAGHAVALELAGHLVASSITHVSVGVAAHSLGRPGRYDVTATVGKRRVDADVSVQEPAGGLVESLAGIAKRKSLRGPLDVTLGLHGPRHDADLKLVASLGALRADAAGTVDLSKATPGADVTVTLPDIAPFAALAHRRIVGRNVLHLVARKVGAATNLDVRDAIEITGGIKPIPALVGPRATLNGTITLDGGITTIHSLTVDAAALTAKIAGRVGRQTIALHGTLGQPDVGLIDPRLSGHVVERIKLDGPRRDLSLKSTIDGVVTAKGIKSGPFALDVAATGLPKAPRGTMRGSGSLDGAKLALDADFARDVKGDVRVGLHRLAWKSVSGHGVVTRAAGATLPDGTLHVAIGNLADIGKLMNLALAGAIRVDFAHQAGSPATLRLDATGIREGRTIALGKATMRASVDHVMHDPAIDATAVMTGLRAPSVVGDADLSAKGTLSALAVGVSGRFADLAGKPARMAARGMVDETTRVVHLASLTAAARGVTARLLAPATIVAKPGLAVRHLGLALGGLGGNARVYVDGSVRPGLDLTVRVRNLPAAVARAADPTLAAHGMVDATAHVTGSFAAPTGTVSLDGRGLGVASGPGAGLPAADVRVRETLLGHAMRGTISASLGAARLAVDGTVPLAMTGPMALTARLSNVSARLVHAVDAKLHARGMVNADARLSGTPLAPLGTVNVTARGMRLLSGPASSLPAADLVAHETLLGHAARGTMRLTVGNRADLNVDGTVPLTKKGAIDLAVTGRTDLRLLDPITEAQGTRVTGMVTPDVRIGGTVAAPLASGRVTLAGGSVENVTSGLHLTGIDALITAAGRTITLDRLHAAAGKGTISGRGTVGLQGAMPVAIRVGFVNASPVSSDVITETLGGAVAVTGAVKTGLRLGGTIDIDSANIEIPKGLPPSVAKLHIIRLGEKAPPAPVPPPPIGLNLGVVAKNQVFIRGDGIFANLGGALHLAGTATHPIPSGGFHLIRGHFDLGGKKLKFTKGTIAFDGGLMPALDLVASNLSTDGVTSTLAVTGTPSAPVITLSSSPTLPSDEVLAHLLYGTGTQSLSALQAISLAASLAQLAGIGGGGGGPLGGVRKALGLDELSLGGGSNGSAAPTVNAGRYVAPGVYVGASQSASGQGTSAKVEVNLYKGLKLDTKVGTGGGAGSNNGESIGLKYQFNY